MSATVAFLTAADDLLYLDAFQSAVTALYDATARWNAADWAEPALLDDAADDALYFAGLEAGIDAREVGTRTEVVAALRAAALASVYSS